MANLTERDLGYGFGILGGALVIAGAIISIAVAVFDLVTARGGVFGAGTEAVVLLVMGGLALFFANLGHRAWADRSLTTGVLLLVIALIAWISLGLGMNVVALVGSIFVFLAGVLYLIEPVTARVRTSLPA